MNATSPEEVARSLKQMRVTAFTLVYQEGPDGEKLYASVPVSSKYEDVLNDARQCFEEYLPDNLDTCKLELKHEIGEGRWAAIHPRVFADLVENAQIGELRLDVRLIKKDRGTTSNSGTKPPPYAVVTSPNLGGSAPSTQVLDTPEIPIVDPQHAAFCNRCNQKISGIRCKCTTCNDFDYCGLCIGFAPLEHGHRFDAIINTHTRVYRPMDAWRITGQAPAGAPKGGEIQHRAFCDICGTTPIVGTRFKCAECPDWDTCQNCLERASLLHPEHTFIRATDPSVLMHRRTKPLDRKATGQKCSRCTKDIRGPTYFKCNTLSCPANYLCAGCEAMILARSDAIYPHSCRHPLIKYYMYT